MIAAPLLMYLPMRMMSIVIMLMSLSACSTLSGWWSDEPETVGSVESSAPSVQAVEAITAITSGSIDVLWRNDVDQRRPASPMGFSLPAAVQTTQGERIVVGGQDQRVRIYDAGGSEISRIALAAACESGALQLSNGLVVLGDLAGTLYGLDIAQSKISWRFTLSSALIGTPIAIDDDFIVQTSNNQLYRFTNDGKKVWSYSGILGGLGMHLTPSPIVYKQRVYTALSNGDVVALRADSGSFVWKRQLILSNKAAVMSQLKVPVANPLLIAADQSGRNEDVLLVSVFQGELSFLSLQDGSTLNRRKLSLKSAPLLISDQVFIADSSGSVSALSALNGQTAWKQKLTDGELTGPILWQGSLWVADDQATVYRLSQTGKLLASTDLNGRIDRAPVAAANGVLVRNSLGTLFMLR